MCGILAVFNSNRNLNELKQAQYEMIHRGPDYQSSKNFNSKISLIHDCKPFIKFIVFFQFSNV